MSQRAKTSLRSLTSLRFFAALLVFALHSQAIPNFLEAGQSGVSFFFILSGFVLAWSARQDDQPRLFWRRRAARVLPAYAVAWILGVAYEAHRVGSHAMHWATVVPGFFLIQSWFFPKAVHFGGDGVAWSLSCEALFYLCFPLIYKVIGTLRDAGVTAVLLGAAALAMLIPAVFGASDPNYYWSYVFPPTRMVEFVLGVAIGVLIKRGRRSPFQLRWALLITVAGYALACYSPVWAAQVTVTVPFYALLIASAASDELSVRPTASWLRHPAMVTLGTWSYCFYLLHNLIYSAFYYDGSGGHHLRVAMALVCSIVASGLLYKLVEHPLERRFRNPPAARRQTSARSFSEVRATS